MGSLDSVIKVTIKVEAPNGAQGPFAKCMLLSSDVPFSDAFRVYDAATASDDMVSDGFAVDSTSVKKVVKMLSADNTVDKIYVAKRAHSWTHTVDLYATAISNSTTYKVTVDGQTASYTSDSSATATEVCDGLAAAITGLAAGVTATNVSNTKVRVTSSSSAVLHSFTALKNLTKKDATSDASAVADYAALKAVTEDFYFVMLDSPSTAAQSAMCAQVESESRLMILQLSDTEATDIAATTDVLSTLQDSGYKRSAAYYHGDNNAMIDNAAVGERAPIHPRFGASWAFKTLNGVQLEDLTATQISALRSKGCNVYEDIGGDSVVRDGVTFSGQYIDTTTGKDALAFDIKVAAWNVLKADKSYTNSAADMVCHAIENVLKVYQGTGNDDGFLDPDYKVSVTHPDVTKSSGTDRAARLLKGIQCKARLAQRLGGLEIVVTILS